MHIEEINIGDLIVMRPTCEDCPNCGEEMTNIMLYGEVCVKCDSPKNQIGNS